MMRTASKLSASTLTQFATDVQTPAYDRTKLKQHIVHIGVGAFHRAHQAVYLDDLLSLPHTERWGECGLGVILSDDRMRDALLSQDCLYTVIERSADAQRARVIGSLVDYIYAPGDREAAIERMAAPDTRIVSLTITEGGYFIDEGSGRFLSEHADIQHDLENPEAPVTSIGLMTEALARRFQRGLPPFTVMSCDNVQGNGNVIREVVLGFAGLRDKKLQAWISEHVTFPNSMVDRITPATKPADLTFVSEYFGVNDAWPVVTEPFRQWVIEDHFCNGRPHWELVGAELVDDVAPYEIMKMRLLNGSHLAMAYLGALADYRFVHEIMADITFISFIRSFMEEVTPVVPRIEGVSVDAYKKSLLERFSNPTINDQVTRICSEGSAKLPKWLLPSIAELLKENAEIKHLCLVVASWIVYLARGADDRSEPIQKIDARLNELVPLAQASLVDPLPFLSNDSIFGKYLPNQTRFIKGVTSALRALSEKDVQALLQQFSG